jgi:hypothetical protein
MSKANNKTERKRWLRDFRPPSELSQRDLIEMVDELLEVALPLLSNDKKHRKSQKETPEQESWLQWGLSLAKEYGPQLLEAAPRLLELLA